VDRVHRLGQTQAVHQVLLETEDSVEANVIALQARKRAVAQRAVGAARTSRGEIAALRLNDLRLLLRGE